MRSCLVSPIFWAVAILLVLGMQAQSQAQVLDLIRSGVRTPGSGRETDRSDGRRSNGDDGEVDWGGNDLFVRLVGYVFAAPFVVPRVLADDDGERGYFLEYPFQQSGYGVVDVERYDSTVAELPRMAWLRRTQIEYGSDFDDLSRFGGQLLIDSAWRFGIDTTANFHRENFRSVGDDNLWLGDFNFVYRFMQTSNFQLRSGLGVNWLHDELDTNAGINFTYGGDWCVAQNWILSTELDWGRLGEVGLLHLRSTLGRTYHHVETYAGYDYLDIGKAQSSAFVVGLRFWF